MADRAPQQRRTRWLAGGALGVALLAATAWLVTGWAAGSRSVDAERVRIAEVVRGDLVRDISADGRVIAANSPTLYAVAGGTVELAVVAGDAVARGDVLATIVDISRLRLRFKVSEGESLRAVKDQAVAFRVNALGNQRFGPG